MKETTIVAIATPLGAGGVSIVRLSGKDSLAIASQLFVCRTPMDKIVPRMMYLGNLTTKDFTEQCLMVYFKAPYSFTGEDVVEFQCHGGRLITQGIVEACLDHGAILAQGGEFSKRAFVNGKLSLDQAEGIMDMISAQSQSEIRAGYQLLNGKLQQSILSMQNHLTNLLARMEVTMDYPEEDIEEETVDIVETELMQVSNEMQQLLATKHTGKLVRDGVKVAIVGRPNAGKSSLMNALLQYERAIVTDIQGTTRDIIEESYLYQGVRFTLVDTAGIRESSDTIEKIGIEKSWATLDYADILLMVIDGSSPLTEEDKTILESIKGKEYFVVINKQDLAQKVDKTTIAQCLGIKLEDLEKVCITISAQSGKVDAIKQRLYAAQNMKDYEGQGVVLTNLRHIESLTLALQSITKALESLKMGNTLDLVAIDIKECWLHLGDVTGNSQNESIITEIFEKFCVGK